MNARVIAGTVSAPTRAPDSVPSARAPAGIGLRAVAPPVRRKRGPGWTVTGILVAWSAWGCTDALCAVEAKTLQYYKRLTPPEAPRRSIAVFDLDDDVLAAADTHYTDIRVLDEEGVETPYLLRTKRAKKTVSTEVPIDTEALDFRELQENRIEIVLKQKSPISAPVAVVFTTGQDNFEKTITVSGSVNREQWQTIVEDQPIFDYARFFDLRNSRVDLPPRPFPYYRVEIANISESRQSPLTRIARDTRGGRVFSEVERTSFMRADFRIDRIQLFKAVTTDARSHVVTREYPVRALAVATNAQVRETVITFETCRAPITRLNIQIRGVNFSREALVETADPAQEKPVWKPLASGRVSRIDLEGCKRDATVLSLPQPTRLSRCRVRIRNLDSPPLEITGVDATGEIVEAVFLREPGTPYHVLYGGSNIASPRYDISDVLRNAETAEADVYALGLQVSNPAYAGPAPRARFNTRALLIAAVVAMVCALALVLAKAVKGIDKLPDA